MTTSHYEVYGTLPTMTEQQKEDMLTAKELPSVSSSDNGKVLTVVEGQWAKAAASGGGGVLVVHESDEGVLDKTWKEISEAQRTGVVIVIGEFEEQITTDIVVETIVSDNEYQVGLNNETWYVASSENGYPTHPQDVNA